MPFPLRNSVRRSCMLLGSLSLIATVAMSSNQGDAAHASTVLPWAAPPITVHSPASTPLSASQFGGDIVNYLYTGWGTSAEGLWPTAALGTDRIWDDQTTWKDVEPARGVWNFSLLDQQVAQARSKGAQVSYVLGQTPEWASSQPNSQDFVAAGAPAPPSRMSDWKHYVAAVASRYKGEINSYEVWDEADASTFSGTPQQMVELAAVAYQTIKQIDPAATVLTPSFTQDSLTSGWLSAYLAAGGAGVADAFAGHAYPNNPEGGGGYVLQYRSALQKAGVSLPIWITETGYQGFTSSGQTLYTSSQAQAYVMRTLMDEAEGGASRVLWYGANSNGVWLSLGEQGYTANSEAYTAMVRWLAGTTPLGCGGFTTGSYAGLSGCYLKEPNGALALLAYDANGTITMDSPSNLNIVESTVSSTWRLLPALSPLTISAAPVLIAIAR